MDPAYADGYRTLYEQHWWWRARERLVWDQLQALCRRPGRERILDIGCGDGLFFGRLSSLGEVEGLEPWAPISSDQSHLTIHRCPLSDFEPAERFSLILMLDVVEHLDDPVADVRHALSLLEPGGAMLITVPAFRLLWTRHDDINLHRTRYTRASFRRLAAESGLRIEHERYFFHWAFAAKLLLRAAQALRPGEPVPEVVPAAPINRALLALCRAEQRLLGPLPVPFGSSLMVVGRAHEG